MTEPWLERWREGRIGWHEPEGNARLRAHWPQLEDGSNVLVPLCGKARDMIWLADHGQEVVGVELSPIAAESFFVENGLEFKTRRDRGFLVYDSGGVPVTIFCGDYFEFRSAKFDALFDRGALVAVPAGRRPEYVAHTKSLLKKGAYRLIITLEYDQSRVDGPPYAVMPPEILSYWNDLNVVARHNDIDNCPPKFKAAGLSEVIETAWSSL